MNKDEYEEWLRKQSEAFQKDILGDDRYTLFKMGMSISEMIDENDNLLSFDHILKKPRSPFGET